ncbi:hypothetical protein FGG08_004552 [Glutinoglossum americanum]|uniref:phospholipase A2 n=1 Tax=Glutinoglossum americanum TaxID=1670608 RepID=A0A9P8I058_9PEZI|nr:hypothetical protein FGG08_004552 [Glutinoglossum americanum]
MAEKTSLGTSPPPPLKLLALDGGGVRGLASLIILKYLMEQLSHGEKETLRPCEYFDLIGGTSTGGLIAIMLGRLQMDVDTAIQQYIEMSKIAFQRKRSSANVLGRMNDFYKVKGTYSSEGLTGIVKKLAEEKSVEKDAEAKMELAMTAADSVDEIKVRETKERCRTFVCCFTKGLNTPRLIRTYKQPFEVRSLSLQDCTIWQAARATSAAASFFDPITISRQEFVDGATGMNNPVEVVLDEARNIWPDAISRIQSIVSIGTGRADLKGFGDNVNEVIETLKSIATETENTEKRFFKSHKLIGLEGRYFRFNVEQGLGDVQLDEHEKTPEIEEASEAYLGLPRTSEDVQAFVKAPRPDYLPPLSGDAKDNALKWLTEKTSDTSSLHNRNRKMKTEGTGAWFLDAEFNRWKTAPRSNVIENIGEQRLGALTYFYFNQQTGRQDFELMLASLLVRLVRGLVQPDKQQQNLFRLPRAFHDLYNRYKLDSEPPIEELRAAFISVVAESKSTYIVIDALDECPGRRDRKDILEFLATVVDVASSNAHILITSRPEGDISTTMNSLSLPSGLIQVPIQNSQVDGDVKKHVQKWVAEHSDYNQWGVDIQELIISELTAKSNGVFKWVECQLNALYSQLRMVDIRDALKELPEDLDETYSRILLKIDRMKYTKAAKATLQWLAFSERPLTVNEAAEVAALKLDTESPNTEPCSSKFEPADRFTPEQIQKVLSQLVAVSGSNSEITFAHFSVKEYLKCERVWPKSFQIQESAAQWFILEGCLAYLQHYDKTPKGVGLERYPLLLYACKYWSHHAIALCCDNNQDVIKRLAELLAKFNGPTLTLSTRVVLGLKRRRSPEKLQAILSHWFKDNPSHIVLPFVLHDSLKAYSYSSFIGRPEFDFESGLALCAASGAGEKELVKLLLTGGANVNAVDSERRAPLHYAARSGHEEVVEMLLQGEASIEMKDNVRGTPLASAIENGSRGVTKRLLERGANVNYHYIPIVSGTQPPLPIL